MTRTAGLLWVEGKDDSAVTQSLCAAHELPKFNVQAKNGIDEILDTFFTRLRAPGADRFGVIVDANGNAQARWDSIRRTLDEEGYREIPERLNPNGVIVPRVRHRPLFGAWIMPDNASPGALEDFAAMLVPAGDPLWVRAGEAVDSQSKIGYFLLAAAPRRTCTRGSHGRSRPARRWGRRSASVR
ncbi:MAG TPA: DUF3226 domain-containing protein [Longimicrobium sp.]